MKVDFDCVIDRRFTNDLKWRTAPINAQLGITVSENMIPMWLADMDFACPEVVVNAVKKRAEHEIYGYCAPGAKYFGALCGWYKRRFNWDVKPETVTVTPTVVAAISIAIYAFTEVGDGVIIQQPVYDPFATLVTRTNRQVINNALVFENGKFVMDYDLLEKQAAQPNAKLMVLCSPHNPVGRVWTKDELTKVDEICRKNGVILLTDEIHSDIVFAPNAHTPVPMLSPEAANNTIYCSAPGKTFNVAGLKTSTVIIQNKELSQAFLRQQLAMSLDVRNTFGIEGVEAAYSQEGEEWLAQLLPYLKNNIDIIENAVKEMPGVKFIRPEGTFLAWVDFSDTGCSDKELLQRIIMQAAVICVPGPWFGPGGEGHMRLNFGCTKATLIDALNRIKEALK